MGLFGTSSPFDVDVERATNEKNTADDWGLIMDICDKVGNNPTNAKDCLRSVVKRLNHNDPHVAVQAVTLLDACVNNCGKTFHLEIASREFENEYRKLITRTHPTVQSRLKALLKKWAEGEFKNDPQLNLIPALYYKLRQEGHVFLAQSEPASKRVTTFSKDPNVVQTQQEEADIAKAIELSLKEKGSPKAGIKASSSLYPSTNLGATTKSSAKSAPSSARKVRALYDFEAAEDNELTFKAGEIVHVVDDSDPNWWKGYNQRGEGLFPANFVTADLSVEPEQFKIETKQATEKTEEVKRAPVEVVEIEESKIDRLLHLLHEANPNDASKDPKELNLLEEQVNGMGPLIDQELEKVDRKHAQLTQLSADLVDALNLYHTLMREPQFSTLPKLIPGGYPYGSSSGPSQQMFNGSQGMQQQQPPLPPPSGGLPPQYGSLQYPPQMMAARVSQHMPQPPPPFMQSPVPGYAANQIYGPPQIPMGGPPNPAQMGISQNPSNMSGISQPPPSHHGGPYSYN